MGITDQKSQSPGGNQATEDGIRFSTPNSSISQKRDPLEKLADVYKLILTEPKGSAEPFSPARGAGTDTTRAGRGWGDQYNSQRA